MFSVFRVQVKFSARLDAQFNLVLGAPSDFPPRALSWTLLKAVISGGPRKNIHNSVKLLCFVILCYV